MRSLIELLLLYLRTPTDITMLAHPDKADTLLVPAVDCMLEFSAVIGETDPRILNKVDFDQVAAQKGLLIQLKKLLKVFKVAAYCVEAGITHAEQNLDGTARFVYNKLLEVLGEDVLIQLDFQPLVDLFATAIVAGQHNKKHGATGGTPAPAHGGTPGTGIPAPGTGGAQPGTGGTQTPPVVTGPGTGTVALPPPPMRSALTMKHSG